MLSLRKGHAMSETILFFRRLPNLLYLHKFFLMKMLELVISPSLSFKDLTLSAQLIYDSLDTDFDTDLCAQ